ncbi:hypothetical protein OROGR_025736 [Orobanche gracilis]
MVYKGQHEQDDDVYGGDVPEEYMESDFDSSEAAAAAESKAKELENMTKRLQEFEGEAGALPQMQVEVEKEMGSTTQEDPSDDSTSPAEKEEIDPRSIYVGNVDCACTPEEVQQHFQSCGTVNRVTILTDKFGQPKGFAYVEFVEVEAVQNALLLGESELHGRQLKVSAKQTNVSGMKQYRGGRPNPQKNVYKDPDDGRQRFLLELEFVQCLANPTYIHYLAQNRYFEDEAFIGYLKYLQYWQRPEYIKFIMYPHCLFFLELLQNPNFRSAMAHPANKELAHRQQFYFWKNYRNNRLKHILPKPLPEPSNVPSASVGPPMLPPPNNTAAPLPSTAVAQAPSPMQYGMGSGSTFVKNEPRSSGIDRRKRK